jgi:hypothetical protein
MQAQLTRPRTGLLLVLAIAAAAALLAIGLLFRQASAPPSVALSLPARQSTVHAAATPNVDSLLTVCQRSGGPRC